jgi:hypothetical protein
MSTATTTTTTGTFTDTDSLGAARAWLRTQLKGGANCPCCTQRAQVYRWSLYSTAVRALAFYHRLGGTRTFVHTPALRELGHTGQGDAARLRLWGLVEEENVRRPDGGRSGWWRVTQAGEDWLMGLTVIDKYALVYSGRCLGFEGPKVNVLQALGTKFDWNDLMRGNRDP